MTSAERGNNVTMITVINATGNSTQPLLVFPRAKFKDHMLNNCPPGSLGAAIKSGWSNDVIFLQFLEHFINNVRPSIEKPVLLLMDNHESHLNISVIELAKKSGIVLMTFHPHTTHKMQPLDRGVFRPFKTFYKNAMNNWMISPGNAGKSVTIYDISYLVGQAYPHAFVPNNIINSFKCTGFYPFNENIFTDIDFLAANVTDRPIVNTEACISNESINVKTAQSSLPSTSSIVLG
nr:MFS-type transporter clz9-like [Hydra vulgaris]